MIPRRFRPPHPETIARAFKNIHHVLRTRCKPQFVATRRAAEFFILVNSSHVRMQRPRSCFVLYTLQPVLQEYLFHGSIGVVSFAYRLNLGEDRTDQTWPAFRRRGRIEPWLLIAFEAMKHQTDRSLRTLTMYRWGDGHSVKACASFLVRLHRRIVHRLDSGWAPCLW